MNDQVTSLGRFFATPEVVIPPKREADWDHRESYRNDVGIARELTRTDSYAVNAVRTKRASIIGQGLSLSLMPDYKALGVSVEASIEWSQAYLTEFNAWAKSAHFECDAQRSQTFAGLQSTIYDSLYVGGEASFAMKFKKGFGPYETCIHIFEPERISTPYDKMTDASIRYGVKRDEDGAPLGYYISQPGTSAYSVGDFTSGYYTPRKWDFFTRYNEWGRPQIVHTFNHIRADMTRGISTFASVIKEMKMLKEYSSVELQSAITQAAWAAVIKTDLDYKEAMMVSGAVDPKLLQRFGNNPMSAAMFGYMEQLGRFYGSMGLRFQGGKIPHLAPNDSLEVVRSTHPNNGFTAFESATLRQLCAGLGIDYPALSKNYADVNYSGARAALADVWRVYQCERQHISDTVGMPIVMCHMEEAILKGRIPMLGKKPWIEARNYLVRGTFNGWGKPLIDAEKERKAQRLALDMGVTTREAIASEEGDVIDDIFVKRAAEEARLKELGLTPEVLMPELGMAAAGAKNADSPKNVEGKD